MRSPGKRNWSLKSLHFPGERIFYQEPGPDISSELELPTEDVYLWAVEDAAQRELHNQPIPPSCADEAQTRNSPGLQLPEYEHVPGSQPQQPLPVQEDRPHKFEAGPNWTMVTRSKTGAQGA